MLLKISIIVFMVLATTVRVTRAVPTALLKNGVKKSVNNAQKNGGEDNMKKIKNILIAEEIEGQ